MVDLELAVTPEQLTQGLSNRRVLPRERGMLFAYDRKLRPSVWMRDTYFPLDVIFVANGQVVDFAARLQPLSEAVITSEQPADCMIEVHAGFIKMHGVARGTRVLFLY